MTTPVAPIAPSERIEILDVLRGFAIFGVLVMIILSVAEYQPKGFGEGTDFFVANKALSLLSMLFGMGFAVQMLRAEMGSRGFLWIYLRRIAVLFGLGVIHWILIWGSNTILISYAVIGCTLLFLRRLPVWALITAACLIMMVLQFQRSILAPIPRILGQSASEVNASRAARERAQQRLNDAVKSGTYSDVVSAQVQTFQQAHAGVVPWVRVLFPAYYLPMAVLGLAIVKSGLHRQLHERRRFILAVMWCALAVGLASNPLPYLPLGKLPVPPWGYRLSFLLSGPSLALFYACGITLALQTTTGHRLLSWLRWPGRMALTNYVAQTIAAIVIADGFGLGLMKKMTVPEAWGIAALVFAVLAWLSAVWLKRSEFGPVEWLWRTLTYGRLSPVRTTRSLAETA